MADVDKLEKMRDKEFTLAKQNKEKMELHKKKAEDLDKQIRQTRGEKVGKMIAPYNLTGEEFENFIAYLKSNKTVEAAIIDIKAVKKKEGESTLHETQA